VVQDPDRDGDLGVPPILGPEPQAVANDALPAAEAGLNQSANVVLGGFLNHRNAITPANFAPMSHKTAFFRAGETIEPIRFARGASSAEVKGAVIRGERALYSFQARVGQHASLRISAPENNAVFQIYAPGAEPGIRDSIMEIQAEALPGEGDDAVRWEGILPGSGTYLLVIGPTRGNAEYRLIITIR
jgi:hypothetical protein